MTGRRSPAVTPAPTAHLVPTPASVRSAAAVGLALLAALAACLVAPAGTADASVPAARITASTYQRDVFRVTNAVRARHDLPRLGHQRCVQRFAVRQAARMAAREDMFHQDLQRVLRRCGLSAAGENVALGFPDGRSVVLLGWMRSPDHRANILHRGYRLLGAGARQSESGVWYSAQVFGTRR